MKVKSLSWWDRLRKRQCSFCGRPLKNKMLFGSMMDRGGCIAITEFGTFYACVDVEKCEKVEKDNSCAAEEAEKKKHQQAIREAR